MKAIKSETIISSLRALTDGGLSLTVHTPELTPAEKAEFMTLQNVVCNTLFEPQDETPSDILEVDKDLDQKSQSERIRSVLFVLWKQKGEPGEFRDFYRQKTEAIINWIKRKLDEEEL